MIPSLLLALSLAGATPAESALTVMFPDPANPNYYNIMTCRGAVRQRSRFRVASDGSPATKNGTVVFRCDGPMTTRVERIPYEPAYFHDTDWAWKFETADGNEVLSGYGAKVMTAAAEDGLHFYVREGYLEP